MKAVGAVKEGIEEYKVHKKAGWRTAGAVAAFASDTNATRRSARLSYSRPENAKKLESEVKAKLEQKRKELKEGNIIPQHKLTAKERIALRLGKNKAPAEGSTGLTDMMEKNKVVDWEDDDDDEEEEKSASRGSKRASGAGSSRGISKRKSQSSSRASSSRKSGR